MTTRGPNSKIVRVQPILLFSMFIAENDGEHYVCLADEYNLFEWSK